MGTKFSHLKQCKRTPTTLSDIFSPRASPYNLHNPASFKMQKVHLVCNSTKTLSHLIPKIWSLVPLEIKQSVSLGDY